VSAHQRWDFISGKAGAHFCLGIDNHCKKTVGIGNPIRNNRRNGCRCFGRDSCFKAPFWFLVIRYSTIEVGFQTIQLLERLFSGRDLEHFPLDRHIK